MTEVSFSQVEDVFAGLVDSLTKELSQIDAISLCRELYKTLEEFLGNLAKSKYQAVPHMALGLSAAPTMRRWDAWRHIAPLTEPIRWLIEMAVKYSDCDGLKPGNAKIDYLIVLASAIYEWDTVWEYIAHGIVPHQLIINADFTLTTRRTSRGIEATNAYRRALRPHLIAGDREWLGSVQPKRKQVSLEEIAREPHFKALDRALKEERGYRLTDYARLSCGLVDSFGPTDYWKITAESRLSTHLSREWQVRTDRLENLLVDYALSKETIADLGINELRPMEYARRDSRLFRRPLVALDQRGKRLYLYGVETVIGSVRLFEELLTSGRLRLPTVKRDGPFKKATGRVQTTLGDTLRDHIFDKCVEEGFNSVREKDKAGSEQIPQGLGFGPVDVFVVDKIARRFVLVEAKNAADDGVVPRLMRAELRQFLNYVDKLRAQVEWFAKRMESLKAEYGIPSGETYSVEGVIVVNAPRVWIYSHTDPLPIVDDLEFFRILRTRAEFMTEPVPA